ncbi:g4831 [Coccomyxa elongata]
MGSLANVSIDKICPAAIDVPSSCKLHVTGRPKDFARDWWADAARAGQLATLHLYSEEAELGPAMLPFLANAGCTTLFWAPAFAALSALYLDGDVVSILLHASLRLRALHIKAKFLTVCIEDPEAVAMSLEEFSAMYGALVGTGMVMLAQALQKVGKAVERVVAATEHLCEGISTR